LPRSNINWRRSRGHLLCQVNLPSYEPNHAKANDNPRGSIHKR